MLKKLFLILLITFGCTKKNVFERDDQIIINSLFKCENGFASIYPCSILPLLEIKTLLGSNEMLLTERASR